MNAAATFETKSLGHEGHRFAKSMKYARYRPPAPTVTPIFKPIPAPYPTPAGKSFKVSPDGVGIGTCRIHPTNHRNSFPDAGFRPNIATEP